MKKRVGTRRPDLTQYAVSAEKMTMARRALVRAKELEFQSKKTPKRIDGKTIILVDAGKVVAQKKAN